MRKKQVKPKRLDNKYRGYSTESLITAYKMVKERGIPVKRAARLCGVPITTLRDRVAGRIDPLNFGNETLFSYEEEKKLVEHLQARAELGYGLSNTYTQKLAGEMAYDLGKRKKTTPLSNMWLYAFLKRWEHEIRSIKPRQLEAPRAKNATPESANTYFQNLRHVMEENNLLDKPNLIFNLDETGIQPEHKPSNVIGNPNVKVQAITSPRSATTTVIACVNALGYALPPFLVFKGKRWNPDLMKGASTGARGKMSETGWSNSEVFRYYLEHHFLPLVRPTSGSTDPILLIYDGHSSHKNPDTIKWAREKGIILFVLPAHTSHIMQPLDVSIFGPFKRYYYSECAQYLYNHMGQIITKYQISALACKAYLKALSPLNIQAGFRKTGIFPPNRGIIDAAKLFPCEGYREEDPVAKVNALKSGPEAVERFLKEKEVKIRELANREADECQCSCMKKRPREISSTKPNASGRAITDDNFYDDLIQYEDQKKQKHGHQKKPKAARPPSPKPSTSGLQRQTVGQGIPVDTDSDLSLDCEEEDDEKCCVCEKSSPPKFSEMPCIKIVNWGQCDNCCHWVHLSFCTEERVVRRQSSFLCPHCK